MKSRRRCAEYTKEDVQNTQKEDVRNTQKTFFGLFFCQYVQKIEELVNIFPRCAPVFFMIYIFYGKITEYKKETGSLIKTVAYERREGN